MHVCVYASLLTASKMQVTWVEHSEYDESAVNQLYRPILSSGRGFGAQRWLAALQRYYECITVLMSPTISGDDQTGVALLSNPLFTFVLFLIMPYIFKVFILSCYSDKS